MMIDPTNDHLIQKTYKDNKKVTFTYDPAGNMLQKNRTWADGSQGPKLAYQYNYQDQLTQASNTDCWVLFVLALEPTFTCVYGMINKSEWFWNPDNNKSNFFLAWRFSHNKWVRYLFGNLGILIINILILVFVWSIVIYSIIKVPVA